MYIDDIGQYTYINTNIHIHTLHTFMYVYI